LSRYLYEIKDVFDWNNLCRKAVEGFFLCEPSLREHFEFPSYISFRIPLYFSPSNLIKPRNILSVQQKNLNRIRKLLVLMFSTALFFSSAAPCFALDVTLAWNASAGATFGTT